MYDYKIAQRFFSLKLVVSLAVSPCSFNRTLLWSADPKTSSDGLILLWDIGLYQPASVLGCIQEFDSSLPPATHAGLGAGDGTGDASSLVD